MKMNHNTSIIEMSLIDAKTGDELELFEEKGSRCHFYRTKHGEYSIQFRIDWTDVRNGDPVLDADISKGKIPVKKEREIWHHTIKDDDKSGKKVYHFKFKDLELILTSKMRVQTDILSDCVIIRKSGDKVVSATRYKEGKKVK